MAVLNTGLAKTSAGDFTIPYSCRFDRASSDTLSRTPSAGNRKTWTLSVWVKRGNFGSINGIMGTPETGGIGMLRLMFDASDNLGMHSDTGSWYQLITTAKYRDPSAWYHIVVAQDTTQVTNTDRVKMYVNGTQITDFNTENYPPEDTTPAWNGAHAHYIGDGYTTGDEQFGGHLAEMHFIDGTTLTPTSFGETGDYGEWKPIEVTGLTYGDEGFYLDFADSAALGDDESGNTNDFTVNNLTAADQMLDTPTNNFCTLMPMANISLSEGNTKVTTTRTGYWDGSHGSLGVSSGKWYYEVVSDVTDSDNFRAQPGWIAEPSAQTKTWNGLGGTGDPSGSHNNNYQNQPHTTSWYKDGSTDGTVATLADDLSIVQWAIDLDNNKVYYGVNNTWEANDGGTDGNPSGGTNESLVCNSGVGDYTPVFMIRSDGTIGSNTMWFNFGQDSSFAGTKTAQGNADGNGYGDFYYTPPTDFLALCTANLDTPAVIPSEHFNTVLYTGDGSTDHAITGVGFQPDLVWIKQRLTGSQDSNVYDSVRGVNKKLKSDTVDAEFADTNALMSFDADGFEVDDDVQVNDNTDIYVAWNWKANGSGSANTDGDIASTVSVNTDAGFSIVSYTGNTSTNQTVGHGLSKIPEIVIIKGRENTSYWSVINPRRVDTSDTNILYLNVASPEADDTNIMGDNLPTATTFGVDDYGAVNTNGEGHIAYCFHSVDGYSKVGLYTGNNDADGPFIYLGFRPKYFMIKAATTTDGWVIYDSLRDSDGTSGYNKGTAKMRLFADSDASETEIGTLDFLSNGVKIRASGLAMNEEHTYIYLAFAETPFKYSNAR